MLQSRERRLEGQRDLELGRGHPRLHGARVAARRERVRAMVGRGRELSEAELDMVMDSPAGQQILHMLHWSTAGTGAQVKAYLEDFAATAQADELMIAPASSSQDQALRSLELLAEAWRGDEEATLPPALPPTALRL